MTRDRQPGSVTHTARRVIGGVVLLWGIVWVLGLVIRAVLWLVSVSLRAVASLYDALFSRRRAPRTLKA